jgi:hypothetical protein
MIESFTEEHSMRLVIRLFLLAACLSPSIGCFVPLYSARPERRVEQLLYTSDDLRSLRDEWERFWFLDQPSHLTPIRTHGGML